MQNGADISSKDSIGMNPYCVMKMVSESYHTNENPCINLIIKEMAKQKSFGNSLIDINVIQDNEKAQEFF